MALILLFKSVVAISVFMWYGTAILRYVNDYFQAQFRKQLEEEYRRHPEMRNWDLGLDSLPKDIVMMERMKGATSTRSSGGGVFVDGGDVEEYYYEEDSVGILEKEQFMGGNRLTGGNDNLKKRSRSSDSKMSIVDRSGGGREGVVGVREQNDHYNSIRKSSRSGGHERDQKPQSDSDYFDSSPPTTYYSATNDYDENGREEWLVKPEKGYALDGDDTKQEENTGFENVEPEIPNLFIPKDYYGGSDGDDGGSISDQEQQPSLDQSHFYSSSCGRGEGDLDLDADAEGRDTKSPNLLMKHDDDDESSRFFQDDYCSAAPNPSGEASSSHYDRFESNYYYQDHDDENEERARASPSPPSPPQPHQNEYAEFHEYIEGIKQQHERLKKAEKEEGKGLDIHSASDSDLPNEDSLPLPSKTTSYEPTTSYYTDSSTSPFTHPSVMIISTSTATALLIMVRLWC